MDLLTWLLMDIWKEKNAIISWSKGNINDFIKGENNNKMYDFNECDIFTLQHWDLVVDLYPYGKQSQFTVLDHSVPTAFRQ